MRKCLVGSWNKLFLIVVEMVSLVIFLMGNFLKWYVRFCVFSVMVRLGMMLVLCIVLKEWFSVSKMVFFFSVFNWLMFLLSEGFVEIIINGFFVKWLLIWNILVVLGMFLKLFIIFLIYCILNWLMVFICVWRFSIFM